MKHFLTVFAVLATTLLLSSSSFATAPDAGQLPQGTITVIGPFPLEIATTEVETESIVVDMSAPRQVDIGLFTVDLGRGKAWLNQLSQPSTEVARR